MGHLRTIRDSQSLDSSMFACVSHGLPTDDVVLLWFLVSVDWPDVSANYNESFRLFRCLDCSACVSGFRFPSKADSD